jgi:hypothetical protein
LWATATLALAQDGLEWELRHAAGGVHRPGATLPVSVKLHNGTARDASLRVEYESEDTVLFRRVDLPAGTRKALTFYIDAPGFALTHDLAIKNAAGRVLGNVQITSRSMPPEEVGVGIVGDHALGWNALTGRPERPDPDAPPETSYQQAFLRPADLPQDVAGLRSLDVLSWVDPRPADLRPGQVQAVARWVEEGGILMLAIDETWLDLQSGVLEPWTSIRARAPVPTTTLPSLAATSGKPFAPLAAPVSVTALEPRGARAWLEGSSGPLGAIEERGRGHVVVLGVNPSRPPLSAWNGWAPLWLAMLDATGFQARLPDAPAQQNQRTISLDVRAQAGNLLTGEHEVRSPPKGLLLLLFAGYLLLIGPADYLLLRRKRRLAWTWVTLPLIVLVVSAISYGVAATARSAAESSRHVIVRDLSAYEDRARETLFASFFAARQGGVAMSAVDADKIALPIAAGDWGDPMQHFFRRSVLANSTRAYSQSTGAVAGLVPKWSYLTGRFVGDAPARGARVDAALRLEDDRLTGRIRAELGFDLDGAVLLLVSDGVPRVFDLGPLTAATDVTLEAVEAEALDPEKEWPITLSGFEGRHGFTSALMTVTARRAFVETFDGAPDWRRRITASATMSDPHPHLDWSGWLERGGAALIAWSRDDERRVEIRGRDVAHEGMIFWRIPIDPEGMKR